MTTGNWNVGDQSLLDFYANKAWNGGDLPKGWRKANPGKPLPPNAYSMTCCRQTQSKSRCYHPRNPQILLGDVYAYTSGLPRVPVTEPSANTNLAALGSLSNAIRGHSFNLAVASAELPEALSMLKNTSTAVLRAARATLRGNWGSVVRNLSRSLGQSKQARKQWDAALSRGDLSGAWLALQYGWKPLLNDAYEAAKAVQTMTSRPRTLRFYGRGNETITTQELLTISDGILKVEDRWIIAYIADLREETSAIRDLGLMDPATVLWEKVPYSFVADWFIPIGNYLSEVSFFRGVSMTHIRTDYGRRSISVSKKATITQRTYPASAPIGGGFKSDGVRLVRSVGGKLDVPLPELKAWAKAFSLPHLQNAAALISQQIRSTQNGITAYRR